MWEDKISVPLGWEDWRHAYHAVVTLRGEQVHPRVRLGCDPRGKWTLHEGDEAHGPFLSGDFVLIHSSVVERCVISLVCVCLRVHMHAHVQAVSCGGAQPEATGVTEVGWREGLRGLGRKQLRHTHPMLPPCPQVTAQASTLGRLSKTDNVLPVPGNGSLDLE